MLSTLILRPHTHTHTHICTHKLNNNNNQIYLKYLCCRCLLFILFDENYCAPYKIALNLYYSVYGYVMAVVSMLWCLEIFFSENLLCSTYSRLNQFIHEMQNKCPYQTSLAALGEHVERVNLFNSEHPN